MFRVPEKVSVSPEIEYVSLHRSIEVTNTKILLTFFQGQNLGPLSGGTVP